MSLKIYNNNNYVVIIVAFSMIISRTLSSHMSASVEAESSTHHSRLPSSIKSEDL
jgi:hypothetical protein